MQTRIPPFHDGAFLVTSCESFVPPKEVEAIDFSTAFPLYSAKYFFSVATTPCVKLQCATACTTQAQRPSGCDIEILTSQILKMRKTVKE